MNFCPLSLQEEIAFHLFSVKFLQEKTIKADSQRSEVRLQKDIAVRWYVMYYGHASLFYEYFGYLH